MVNRFSTALTENDVRFLVEVAAPQLLSKINTVKGDPAIIDGILAQNEDGLFEKMTQLGGEEFITQVSPRFLFEVLLRRAVREMRTQSYTIERSASQRIPVFDAGEVARFFTDKALIKYLADMLSSFTRTESYTHRVRVRRGIWRRTRFSELDLDSLVRLCETADDEYRFTLYKRIGDLCLFILGVFPEYALPGAPTTTSGFRFSRFRRSTADYESDGRRFYRLAREHRSARILQMDDIFGRLEENFHLARKPLNYISEHFLVFRKMFPAPS